MKELAFKCWVKAQMAKQNIKEGITTLKSEETGGADGIVIAVIILIIVIALAAIFHDAIFSFVGDLMDQWTGKSGGWGEKDNLDESAVNNVLIGLFG